MKINIAPGLKKFIPIFLQAQKDGLKEADTSQRIFKFFCDVLEYDALNDISKEVKIMDGSADFVVKVDSKERFIVEIKGATIALNEHHRYQGERYASRANIQWVIVTNGTEWKLYHLSFIEGIEYSCAFEVNLATDPIEKSAEMIGLLHRSSIKHDLHEAYWEKINALSPASIGRALFYEDTILLIRRRIRHKEGILIDPDDLAEAIHKLFSKENQIEIGPPKIKGKKIAKKEKSIDAPAPPSSDVQPPTQ